MKIFIMVDMEGVNGVVTYDRHADPDGSMYPEARRTLMRELTAAVEGALAAGATEVLIYDMHVQGLNVVPSELPACARAILGKPIDTRLDSSFDAMFMIGYHAMAGTAGALLPHSYALDIEGIWLNGTPVGEIGMEAALAGVLGVPLVMVSGDSVGMEEALALLPGIQTAVVKWPVDSFSAICLPTVESEAIIREKAEIAVRRREAVGPYRPIPPFEIRIRFSNRKKAALIAREDNVVRLSKHEVAITGDDLHRAWLTYKRLERKE